MVRSMRMIFTNEALTDSTQVDEATPIREGWSGRYRGTCLVEPAGLLVVTAWTRTGVREASVRGMHLAVQSFR